MPDALLLKVRLNSYIYFHKKCMNCLIFMLLGGCLLQGTLLFVPEILPRYHVEMMFILYILVIVCLLDIFFNEEIQSDLRKKFSMKTGLFILTLLSLWLFGTNLEGYRKNARVYELNHKSLMDAYNSSILGREITDVMLYKLPDDDFAGAMAYQAGYEIAGNWMKKAYGLPESTLFRWLNNISGVNYGIREGEWYDDKWLGNSVTLFFDSAKEKKIILQFTNVSELENLKIICKIDHETNESFLSETGMTLVEIIIPRGESTMTITASETMMPTKGDCQWCLI